MQDTCLVILTSMPGRFAGLSGQIDHTRDYLYRVKGSELCIGYCDLWALWHSS
jgi:hypothetical protein